MSREIDSILVYHCPVCEAQLLVRPFAPPIVARSSAVIATIDQLIQESLRAEYAAIEEMLNRAARTHSCPTAWQRRRFRRKMRRAGWPK